MKYLENAALSDPVRVSEQVEVGPSDLNVLYTAHVGPGRHLLSSSQKDVQMRTQLTQTSSQLFHLLTLPDWSGSRKPSDVDGVEVGAVEVRRRSRRLRLQNLLIRRLIYRHDGQVTCTPNIM